MTAVAERLHELDGVSRVRIETAVEVQHSLVLATVSHDATDHTLRGTASPQRSLART